MIITRTICDLCHTDGYERKAHAVYTGEGNQEYHCCRKHLKDIKAAGMSYQILSNDDN